jgi:DNA-binding FadR family transcriptional regulator
MLKKTNRVSLVEQVAAQMEELVGSGNWAVGDKLPPELQLMEEFDVSRNTLREAIRALVHAGLLETKQGSGTIVRSKSALGVALHRRFEKSSSIETLEVRLALEREGAQLAAKRRSDEDLEKLEKYIEKCRAAAEKKDLEAFIAADITFHQMIIKAAKNQVLLDLYEHMTDSIYTSIHDSMLHSQFNYDNEIHHELLEAIRNKDIAQASNYVDDYIHTFKKRFTTITEGSCWKKK